MSKVRNLPEILSLSNGDLIYAVESAVNPNGGRRATIATLRSAILEAAAVKAAYESNADTNAFTDAEKAKLATIESGAQFQNADEVPYDNSVSGLSATEVQTAIDQVNDKAQADFRPSIESGRILHYTGGTARFDGVFYELVANDILLNQNVTNGEVYVDTDGVVKQTGTNVLAPPYTVVFAKFSTDLNNIISLIDVRVKNAQNIIRGITADVRDVRAGAAAAEGNSGRVSDAMHKHNILTGAASTQIADQANAEGTSVNLARADHVHNIPTAAPVQANADGNNQQGTSDNFAKSDHKHDIATAVPVTQNADQANAEGVSTSLARADHVHDIPTAAPVQINADGNNNQGVANTFAKSDHKHNIATAAPVSQAPDQANAEGTSSSVARADHVHNIPAAAPTTNLSPATTNAEGVGSSFARNDHTHALDMAQAGNLSTINAGDTENLGSLDRLVRADHQHPVATAAATSVDANSTNTEGVSTSLARADHTHDLATGAPSTQAPDQANAEGTSPNLARADHIHNIPAAAPITNLSPATANAEGTGSSFARNDHTHAVATGLVADVTTIQPDDAAAAGTVDRFARADHRHAIAAASAVSVATNTTNAEGVSTSFARADHTHAVSLPTQEATATVDDTTTSTTDTLLGSMTLTPAAGTYLVLFNTSTVNSGNGAERNYFSLYSGGSQVSGTERKTGVAGGSYSTVAIQGVTTVNGSQAIEIRWRVIAGTGTAAQRKMILVRLA